MTGGTDGSDGAHDSGAAGGPAGDIGAAPVRRRRWWKWPAVVCGALVAAVVVLYGVDVAMTSGEVPPGTRIAGLDVGGLEPDEAADRLRGHVEAQEALPITVQAGETTTRIVPAEAGLGIDVEATVAAAGTGSWNPWRRLTSLVSGRDVPVVQSVDRERVESAVESVRREVDRPVREGTVDLSDGEAVPVRPRAGQKLDVDGAADVLAGHWADAGLGGDDSGAAAVELPVQVTEPRTTMEDVQQVLDGFAREAVAGPVTIAGDGADAVLAPERIPEIVRIEQDDEGALAPRFDDQAAQSIVGEQLAGTVSRAQDATVRLGAGGPEVVPSQDGRRIDWDATFDDWRALFRGDRVVQAVYEDDPAEFSTGDAESMGIDEVVGEFTTSGFSDASGVNIRRVAQEVDGAVVRPGDEFSLNGYTGPRGTAQGYIESGVILNGHADTAVGGGISQFATTLFNASYFAGMDDVAHQEHSYYISRYPVGREATVYMGAIDLVFRNPADTGILIEASGDADSVTVRIWGTKTVDVESVNGGRWDYTEPQRMTLSAESCSPSSGAPGFTTSDTRIIRDSGSGAVLSRSTETTVYDPSPIVSCR